MFLEYGGVLYHEEKLETMFTSYRVCDDANVADGYGVDGLDGNDSSLAHGEGMLNKRICKFQAGTEHNPATLGLHGENQSDLAL